MTKPLMWLLLPFTLSATLTLKNPNTNVYVCVSITSVAYHSNRDCKGLSLCTHKIAEVTAEDAVKEYKKRKCKLCY